ncbi:MAG: site-specific DNA-methyltransferase [Paludibaculum sp.]
MSFVIYQGNSLDVLRHLADESVDCCVTSPPYWGARDYETGSWSGGDPDCKHQLRRGLQGKTGERAGRRHTAQMLYLGTCGRCGAIREDEQIGLEQTPEEFIERLVLVFREVRRILKPKGVLWVNMGDTYCSRPNGSVGRSTLDGSTTPHKEYRRAHGMRKNLALSGLKHKDLVGGPWLLAFALRKDGWWLRQDCIWAKPNPQPESVKDRCTKAHEYVFLLSKSARYFWNFAAMQEPVSGTAHPRGSGVNQKASRFPRGWDSSSGSHRLMVGRYHPKQNASFSSSVRGVVKERNKRSVWTLPTQPFKGSHFATFPVTLAQICIRAGCPPNGVVLDPFAGAGSTGIACLRLGCRFLGVELNAKYIDMAYRRADAEMEKAG